MSMSGTPEVRVFSPSAMHSSLEALAAAHRDASGVTVSLAFEIAPAFRKRLEAGEKADVLIAPPKVMDELVQIGKARAQERIELGRVGVGVVVRKGAPMPDVSSKAALERSLLDAESVVYNYASSGMYSRETHREARPRAGACAEDHAPPRRTGAFTHLLRGKGREIGFGGVTEIGRWRDKGLVLVAPLPAGNSEFHDVHRDACL